MLIEPSSTSSWQAGTTKKIMVALSRESEGLHSVSTKRAAKLVSAVKTDVSKISGQVTGSRNQTDKVISRFLDLF